eukprot:TRINITY_DN63185_c0_g1_i1.p1 TRINITY_DN63185_c0_g1~~TRINITY_DN63185_c0_g1_i1.p1  ORF type:complete len:732 (-),score=133.39 TRINITY_DN63185_c0_g1_i1:181-2355(-)
MEIMEVIEEEVQRSDSSHSNASNQPQVKKKSKKNKKSDSTSVPAGVRRGRRRTLKKDMLDFPDPPTEGDTEQQTEHDKAHARRRKERDLFNREKDLRAREEELEAREDKLHQQEQTINMALDKLQRGVLEKDELRESLAAVTSSTSNKTSTSEFAVQTDVTLTDPLPAQQPTRPSSASINALNAADLQSRTKQLQEREKAIADSAIVIDQKLAELAQKEKQLVESVRKNQILEQQMLTQKEAAEAKFAEAAALKKQAEEQLAQYDEEQGNMLMASMLLDERNNDLTEKLAELEQSTTAVQDKEQQVQDDWTKLQQEAKAWQEERDLQKDILDEEKEELFYLQDKIDSAETELNRHERVFESKQKQLAEVLRQEREMERSRVLRMAQATGDYHGALLSVQLQRINLSYGSQQYNPTSAVKRSNTPIRPRKKLKDYLPFKKIEKAQTILAEEKAVKSLSSKFIEHLHQCVAEQNLARDETTSTATSIGAQPTTELAMLINEARADPNKYTAAIHLEEFSMIENKEIRRVYIRECELQKEALWVARLRKQLPVLQKWANVDSLMEALHSWYTKLCTLLDDRAEQTLMERKQNLEIIMEIVTGQENQYNHRRGVPRDKERGLLKEKELHSPAKQPPSLFPRLDASSAAPTTTPKSATPSAVRAAKEHHSAQKRSHSAQAAASVYAPKHTSSLNNSGRHSTIPMQPRVMMYEPNNVCIEPRNIHTVPII